MNERAKRLSRRSFLLAAGAGGVAAAAAVVSTRTARQAGTSKSKDKRATRGYAASEHVHNYYRTTKV